MSPASAPVEETAAPVVEEEASTTSGETTEASPEEQTTEPAPVVEEGAAAGPQGKNPFEIVYDNGKGNYLHASSIHNQGVVLKAPEGLCFVPNVCLRSGADGIVHIQ